MFLERVLLLEEFVELCVQCLAHGSVSHTLVTLDAVLQHRDSFQIILFHNCVFLCFPRFGKRIIIPFL